MEKLVVKSFEEFEDWCEKHQWFEDSRVFELKPLPKNGNDNVPEEVTVKLGYQVDGSVEANEEAIYQMFELKLKGVGIFSIADETGYLPEHFTHGFDLYEEENKIVIDVDVPAKLIVSFSEVEISALPDYTEVNEAWLSGDEVSLLIQDEKEVTPTDWIKYFADADFNMSWHIFDGEETEASDVPENYEGWYIQQKGDLEEDFQGLFFAQVETVEEGTLYIIENDGVKPEVWSALMRIVGKIDNVEISSGNCTFSGKDWLTVLEENEL